MLLSFDIGLQARRQKPSVRSSIEFLVMPQETKNQLKKLEEARDKLAKQIESSKEALAELDEKIQCLKQNIEDMDKNGQV